MTATLLIILYGLLIHSVSRRNGKIEGLLEGVKIGKALAEMDHLIGAVGVAKKRTELRAVAK